MKKSIAYSLDEEVIKRIDDKAYEERISKSSFLNRKLREIFGFK